MEVLLFRVLESLLSSLHKAKADPGAGVSRASIAGDLLSFLPLALSAADTAGSPLARPIERSADRKLRAPYRTSVEGRVENCMPAQREFISDFCAKVVVV